jgi:MFS family permease
LIETPDIRKSYMPNIAGQLSVNRMKRMLRAGSRLSTSMLGLVCGIGVIGGGQTLLYTVLGPATREIGIGEFQTGMIVTMSALVLTCSSPFWGRLIDKWGSRKAYIVGMASYAVGSFIFAGVLALALARIITPVLSLMCLIAVRCVYAFMTAGIYPAAMKHVADVTNERDRGGGMAVILAAANVGSILGPILGSVLGSVALLLPIFVTSALALIATATAAVSLHDARNPVRVASCEAEPVRPAGLRFADRRISSVLIATALAYIAFSALQQSLPFYLQDILRLDARGTARSVGIAMGVLATAMVATQLGIVKFLKPGAQTMLTMGSASLIGGLLCVGAASTLPAICGAQILVGIGFGLFLPGAKTAASLAVAANEQGAVAGLIAAASAAGVVVGPLIGTGLVNMGASTPYFVGAVVMLLALLLTHRVVERRVAKTS